MRELIRNESTIYTVGHGALDLNDYLALLQESGIEQLVDVRSAPYSRYVPHFNREQLEATLQQHGIEYRYAGEHLGGRPTEARFFKNGEIPTGSKPNYLRLVDYPAMQQTDAFQTGVSRLTELARTLTTAIQCSEENPLKCHRHFLIADWLVKEGWTVMHIRHDGSAENAATYFEESRQELEIPVGSSQLSFL
jgi:uncharacterized protein (DUF488 family)